VCEDIYFPILLIHIYCWLVLLTIDLLNMVQMKKEKKTLFVIFAIFD